VADESETLLGTLCSHLGLPVWFASDAAAAVEIFRWHETKIAIVLVDVWTLDGDAASLLANLREIKSEVTCYFMSGDWTPPSDDVLREMGVAAPVVKPFFLETFKSIVRAGLTDAQSS
jgi:DNA-binding NtrC family response regulator